MRSDKRILAALVLNVSFAVLELIGGALTGSVAILSDAVHDFGDALSIALSYGLERKSCKAPDDRYTYGYARFSLLGALITSAVLLVGSVAVIWHAVEKLIMPTSVHYDGMIMLAVLGVLINGGAVLFTQHGSSFNQRAVSLHMLEDVCGWVVVLLGAFVMKLTDWQWIDPLLSIGVATALGISAVRSLCAVLRVCLERAPLSVDMAAFCEALEAIEGVMNIHHVHVWSLDGQQTLATLHVVAAWEDFPRIKAELTECSRACGVTHVTVQWDAPDECEQKTCRLSESSGVAHSHHHHHVHG